MSKTVRWHRTNSVVKRAHTNTQTHAHNDANHSPIFCNEPNANRPLRRTQTYTRIHKQASKQANMHHHQQTSAMHTHAHHIQSVSKYQFEEPKKRTVNMFSLLQTQTKHI